MVPYAGEPSPDSPAPEIGVDELGYLLVQVSKLHRVQAHAALEKLGVYRGQNFVLTTLSEQEGLAQSELADRLLVRPPTISNSLDRMEAAGWIERRPDPGDRRVSRVYLTEAGRALRDSVSSLWHDLETQTFAGLTSEQRDSLWQMLHQIRDNLWQRSRPLPS
jgi:DNA-binding MarR family transcriptional regulator